MLSSSSSSSSRNRRRKWTREQLLKHLEVLGPLEPLPPTLPLSPPASRSTSPVSGTKRKAASASASDVESVKRQRTNAASLASGTPSQTVQNVSSSGPSNPARTTAVPPPHVRTECEDGELREDTGFPAADYSTHHKAAITRTRPIHRPRKPAPTQEHFNHLHEHYYNAGRKLKYSGDARYWSSYSSNHKEYKALDNPPSPDSPYHKHGGLIARLELAHALVCFTYALWTRDYSRRTCHHFNWTTCEGFLVWCKQKWQQEEGMNDAEKAFLGLIYMIEAFIHARKVAFTAQSSGSAVRRVVEGTKADIATAIKAAEEGPQSLLGVKSQTTPPMLPSPASIATASSANSTPTNREDNQTASSGTHAISSSVTSLDGSPVIHPLLLSSNYSQYSQVAPSHVVAAANSVTTWVKPQMIGILSDLSFGLHSAKVAMDACQKSLTLPILAEHFPRTFDRMVYSTLKQTDEHEPDMEDEEGELFWPGQCINGEGLGWVCLMGHAMIKEFGKGFGYLGLAGIVPKPESHLLRNGDRHTPSRSAVPGPHSRSR